MIRIADYSLNYARLLAKGEMTIPTFLSRCRQMQVDGAALHIRDLPDPSTSALKLLRRQLLDHGLTPSMFTVSTDFGKAESTHRAEFEKAQQAIRAALLLGSPLLRVFAGSPPSDADREESFKRAAAGVRRVVEEAAGAGLPVGLQNHNHGALGRTGDECLRMLKLVDHPNLTFVLDTGQFAGSRGASGKPPAELANANPLDSIRQMAPLARHVRVKFYNPRPDGSEPWINYDEVFNILRSVHYHGFLDIVYEPGTTGDDIRAAMPRIVRFLRGKTQAAG